MVKSFDYINNFSQGQEVAKMSVRRPIDQDPIKGINGDQFAKEMEFLAASGVKEVIIDINSKGGNIKEGFSIFQAIKDFPGKTITRVVGIAASMAGMISQAGDERVILDYGLFHTHGPQVPKGKKVEKGLISLMQGSLKTILTSKAGISEEKAEELLTGENLFTAVEAQKMGFFDRIESSKDVLVLDTSNSLDELYEMANEFINTKTNKMEKLVSFLGLENTANEEEVLKSVEELKNNSEKVTELTNELEESSAKVTELEASLEAETSKVTELENTVSELKKAAAESLINEFVEAGKLQKESTAKWLEMAQNDLESTKELLSGLGSGVSSKADDVTNELEEDKKDDRKEWTYDDWQKRDSEGLLKMKNEKPEQFEDLINEWLEAE